MIHLSKRQDSSFVDYFFCRCPLRNAPSGIFYSVILTVHLVLLHQIVQSNVRNVELKISKVAFWNTCCPSVQVIWYFKIQIIAQRILVLDGNTLHPGINIGRGKIRISLCPNLTKNSIFVVVKAPQEFYGSEMSLDHHSIFAYFRFFLLNINMPQNRIFVAYACSESFRCISHCRQVSQHFFIFWLRVATKPI